MWSGACPRGVVTHPGQEVVGEAGVGLGLYEIVLLAEPGPWGGGVGGGQATPSYATPTCYLCL